MVPSIQTGTRRDSTIRSAARLGVRRADQQHHEFVAAQPCHDVVRADAGAQPPAHLDQHLVAGVVAQDVVDFLEVVQVQQQDVDGGAARARAARSARRSLNSWRLDSPVSGSWKARALSWAACSARSAMAWVIWSWAILAGVTSRKLQTRPTTSSATSLRAGIAFKGPAVAEVQDVVAFRGGVGVERGDLFEELGGIRQLVQDEAQHGFVVPGGEQFPGDAPHGEELVVDAGDLRPRR